MPLFSRCNWLRCNIRFCFSSWEIMHCFLVDENLFLPKTLFYLWFRIVPQLLSFYIYSLRQAWKSAAHVIVFGKNFDIMACQSSVSERILINSVVQKKIQHQRCILLWIRCDVPFVLLSKLCNLIIVKEDWR